MSNLFSDFGEYANEIVFSRCDITVFNNFQSFLEKNNYRLTKKCKSTNRVELLLFESVDNKILVCKEEVLDAIFVYVKKTDAIIQYFLQRCPRCSSKNIVERIPYSFAIEKDWEQIEQGKLEFFPGAYDRKGVPVQNRKCKECGLEWHNKEDLMKRYNK